MWQWFLRKIILNLFNLSWVGLLSWIFHHTKIGNFERNHPWITLVHFGFWVSTFQEILFSLFHRVLLKLCPIVAETLDFWLTKTFLESHIMNIPTMITITSHLWYLRRWYLNFSQSESIIGPSMLNTECNETTKNIKDYPHIMSAKIRSLSSSNF